ncbi:MAG: indolepyruvate ferredoxin oxidoreductase subunit alpha [Betaproteobacteria bacterium]|nr:indolepyruvate ferredoxin oxidoreductase subunit alpha [Betaproteobacteria bacterium]MBK7514757.1 indolepyruvate ferredoxin oxidoreductase subunit alpha [Betaproteobacteria bacterium]
MEVSFYREIESLKLGAGQVFHGEGILAVTKALLQSGVTYVGGYQGSPVSHLLDVMVQARPYLDELGVHVEACTNESSAAAMLAASMVYPVRGAVTWKSIVGTNVAADALSNLASPGVLGGALVIVGEDYGEGASVIQERSHAFAMKSALWLLDPRPDLTSLVRLVRQGFELSEASNTPVMMELRIRSCHLQGSFVAADNVAPAVSSRQLQSEPAAFSYDRLSHPPSTFRHEKLKYEVRMPAARRFIVEHAINEVIDGDATDLRELGLIVQGGLTHTLLRAMAEAGLTDGQDRPRLALLVLNCVYPLVPEQITAFCSGRRAVLVLEEGQPDYIEQDIATTLRRAGVSTPLHGKDLLSMGGEYNAELLLGGLMRLLQAYRLDAEAGPARARLAALEVLRETARRELGSAVPPRPPNFCIGCPERPVFAALKLVEQQIGRVHVAADIGCHSFATFEPFSFGQSILGYGMSMASSAAVKNFSARRPLAIMGDGGFWHNGLLSGVSSTLLNGGDGVLLIMKNGYTSATGTQETISTPGAEERHQAEGRSATGNELTIEKTLAGLGVKWLRTVHNYRVASVRDTLREALTSPFTGLKVIVAEGECQLERQRRLRPRRAARLARGERVVRTRYGVDEATCSGDHSCIRLSGCPTLTVKTAGDPLKRSPVAHVQNECVGCGLCGEVAHAAVLCPSFYRAEVITHPGWWERLADRINRAVIGWLQPA